MDTDLKRRLVSLEQLKTLLHFMKEHPDLASGLSRGRRGKLMTVKVWNNCAKKLNSIKDGAVKDAKGWSKYWCDWKYRVRRHALEIQVAADCNKTLPEGLNPLSPVEETILKIIGGGSIDGVVIKTDPLGDEDSNDDEQAADDTEQNNQYYETRSGVKRRLSTKEAADDDEGDDNDDDDAPPEQKARFENEDDDDENNEEEVVNEVDNTAQFLALEKMQLENSRRIQKSICRISLEICKLTDIMAEIRDVLVKRLDIIT